MEENSIDNENNNNLSNIDSNTKEEDIKEQEIREIQIDSKLVSKQVKLDILGIEIYFPYEPYENQKLYMKKVIEALQDKGIAGLESPTGTGKTLCLLCASLAYLKHIREELKNEKNNNISNEDNKNRQPVIFYTSRTHAQISNVIKELKKTVYRPINSVISSREQSCVNEFLNQFNGSYLNLKCKYATKKGECKYYKGKSVYAKGWSSFDGLIVDELKEKGKKYKFCPYYYEKDKSQYSDIVFLPYNYIFDMKILKSTKLVLSNSILIIDEAHNLQDICCDSSSTYINTNIIDEIISDLKALKSYIEEYNNLKIDIKSTSINSQSIDAINTKYLQNEISILTILKERIMKIKLSNKNITKGQNPGIKLDTEQFFELIFKEYKGSQTTIPFFNNSNNDLNENEYNTTFDKNESNNEIKPEITSENITKHISFLKNVEFFINNDRGKSTLIPVYTDYLEIINILSNNYYDKEAKKDPSNLYVNNFRFYVEEIKEQNYQNSNNKKKKVVSFSNNSKDIKRVLHIFCLNPGFGFKMVMDLKLYSTIITSGTLAPIDSLESELKYNFNVKLENNHVISDEQFHFCLLTSSAFNNNIEFNFNIDKRMDTEMIYELGLTILEFCKFIPGGILVFFSSYNIMDKYINEWSNKKIISEICKYKEFYHDRRDQRQNKQILSKYQLANSDRKKYKGGILFSVCRGSCSEGMNFKDDMARLVIVVGIPYAMLYDPRVQLKKEFQDEYNQLLLKNSKNSKIKKLSGSEWYTQNAIKCVNQSLGRVIRHSNDYGAMLLIDTRYQNLIRYNYISQWMRKKCKIYNNENKNKSFFEDMKNFFIKAEKIVEQKKKNLSQLSSRDSSKTNNDENIYSHTSNKKENSKNSKIIKKKMNETEKLRKNENNDNKFNYNSKNRKIYEVKIGEDKCENEEVKNNLDEINFEDLDNIDENYFEKLSETPNSKESKELNIEKKLSSQELIEEIIKKKNDKNFLEELEKKGIEVSKNENEKESSNISNSLSCKVCYFNTSESNIKLEVGKCGHILCQNCWSKIEDKKGNSICPLCRKKVKKKDRNIIYI